MSCFQACTTFWLWSVYWLQMSSAIEYFGTTTPHADKQRLWVEEEMAEGVLIHL